MPLIHCYFTLSEPCLTCLPTFNFDLSESCLIGLYIQMCYCQIDGSNIDWGEMYQKKVRLLGGGKFTYVLETLSSVCGAVIVAYSGACNIQWMLSLIVHVGSKVAYVIEKIRKASYFFFHDISSIIRPSRELNYR